MRWLTVLTKIVMKITTTSVVAMKVVATKVAVMRVLAMAAGLAVAPGFLSPAFAAAGQPEPWQMAFQDSVTPVMDDLIRFDNFLLVIIAAISAFVLFLLLFVMIRFNARANPEPSRVTHNTLVEVVWTVVPTLILIVIAVPSFRLLYKQAEIPVADVTIKATGNQWNWTYEYPEHEGLEFTSVMLQEDELKPGQPYLLETDTEVVVPVNKVIRVQVTASDVIHAWAVPSFGVKMDAVPGRLNETWFKATRTGIYYGQCSELCGIEHAFMPIRVRVVSDAEYTAWLTWAMEEYASVDTPFSFAAVDQTEDTPRIK